MVIDTAVIEMCAPQVAVETMQRIIHVESQGNYLAVHINGKRLSTQPTTVDEAVAIALEAIEAGYTVDLGLMQINSSNLAWLGYSVVDMFDICKNLQAGARVLQENYARAIVQYGEGQKALQAALSAYNTGYFDRGITNGYVGKIYGNLNATTPLRRGDVNWDSYTNETTIYRRD